MIKRIFTLAFITMSLIVVSTSCSSDEEIIDIAIKINEIKSNVTSGTWRITSYIDSGIDETSDFTGYNFTFNENGTLTASNVTDTFTGSWSVTEDDNSDDDDDYNDEIDFNISFLTPDNFTDLSDDWDITFSNSTKIDLIDISGGNGGTDTLTFEKN